MRARVQPLQNMYPETNKIKVSREVIFRHEITNNKISINVNERKKIINNLSEITMKLT